MRGLSLTLLVFVASCSCGGRPGFIYDQPGGGGGRGGVGGSGGTGGSGRTLDCSTGPLVKLWSYDPPDGFQILQAAPALDRSGNAFIVECDATRVFCHLISLDGQGHVGFNKNTSVPAAPVIAGQQLVLAFDDRLELRDLATGALENHLEFPGEAVARVVESSGGLLVVATTVGVADGAHVLVRGILAGKEIYNSRLDGPNVPVLVADQGGNVFGSVDETHVFELAPDGTLSWSADAVSASPVAAFGHLLLLEGCSIFDTQSRQASMSLGDAPCSGVGTSTAAFVLHGSSVDAVDPVTGSGTSSMELPAEPEPQVLLLTGAGTALVPIRDADGGKLLEIASTGEIINTCALPTDGVSFHAALGPERLLYRSESTSGGTSLEALDLPGLYEPDTGWTASNGSSRHSEKPR